MTSKASILPTPPFFVGRILRGYENISNIRAGQEAVKRRDQLDIAKPFLRRRRGGLGEDEGAEPGIGRRVVVKDATGSSSD
jgi:hypothetical protein